MTTDQPPQWMRDALHADGVEKVFCPARRRRAFVTRKWWGLRKVTRLYVVASCTRWLGHKGDEHVDAHSGHRWTEAV